MAYCVSRLVEVDLGDATLVWYIIFVLDAVCASTTIVIGLVFARKIIGIGVGTILAVIFVGRVVAVGNHLFKEKIVKCSGLE